MDNIEILSIHNEDQTSEGKESQVIKNLHAHNMLLLTKPATGWSQHISPARKSPPKKLFDYLPKGRRIIFKDNKSGAYKVLIPIERRDLELL